MSSAADSFAKEYVPAKYLGERCLNCVEKATLCPGTSLVFGLLLFASPMPSA